MISYTGLSEDSDTADEDQQRPNQLRRGRSHGLRHAQRAVTWTDAQLSILQVGLPLLAVCPVITAPKENCIVGDVN